MNRLNIYTVTPQLEWDPKTGFKRGLFGPRIQTYWLPFKTLLTWHARDTWDYKLPERFQFGREK